MFGRLGVFGRLTFIILLLLAAFVALGIGISHIDTDRKENKSLFPVPEQAASIAELLDRVPDNQHSQVMKAVRSSEIEFAIVETLPDIFSDLRRMPSVEWLITQYLETYRTRKVFVTRDIRPQSGPVRSFIDWLLSRQDRAIVVAVELKSKRYVLLRFSAVNVQRLFGVPVGFFFGVYGFLFAALALWAIAREAKPLQQLARSVELFGHDGRPRLVGGRGASEIQKLIKTVNDMQERIAALIRGRTILLGAVSHDLKTYITRLRLRVEQISSDVQREKAVADLEQMTAIIDDAISLAKGDVDGSSGFEDVDISQLIRADIDGREISEQVDFKGDTSCIVKGDETALKRMLANLIDNALRYGTRCDIAVSEGTEVLIDDDGPGIPEGDRKAVFEPFYRLEQSRNRNTGGSGLGLAIVKQIVDVHGAEISIDSNEMGGTRVIVRFANVK